MPVEIRVPQLGESIVEATISQWIKKEGDLVTAGEPIVELETDKVNVQVPAEGSGVVTQVTKQEGETVAVGDLLAMVALDGEDGGEKEDASHPTSTQGAPTAETASSSVSSLQPTTAPGSNGDREEEEDEEHRGEVLVSPVARRLAEENKIDLRRVTGTGSSGRVTKEDVASFIEHSAQSPATANRIHQETVEHTQAPSRITTVPSSPAPTPTAPPPATQPAPPAPASSPSMALASAQSASQRPEERIRMTRRPEERIRMTRRRQTIATRLVEAQHTAAMLTTFNEIDMSAVMEVRSRRKESFKEKHGVGLGFMSFFTKATVGALKAYPFLNAEIQGTEIVAKKYYDIGVAVSTEEGLVVPVVRDADRKTFAEIEKVIVDLATRARSGQLTLPELQGGTFTITNGGVFGSLLSTPILNAPQVGILGMHKIEERPIAKNGEVVIRPMMYVALSYDHRIVDGSEAVRFLVRLKELIEDPEALLLEG